VFARGAANFFDSTVKVRTPLLGFLASMAFGYKTMRLWKGWAFCL
jgi:hypothetical protein